MKIKINKVVYWLAIVILIFVSDDTLLFGTNSNALYNGYLKFAIYFALLLLLLFILKNKEKYINRNSLLTLLTLIVLVVGTCFFNLDFRFGYIYKIIILSIGFFVANAIDISVFVEYYMKVLLFISGFSLLSFCIELLNPSLLKIFPVVTNSANNQYYNLFLSIVPVENWGVPRNYGIFREPGVYIIFLIIALIFEVFTVKKTSFFKQILLAITILTTRSTTGYIALLFIYLIYVFKKSYHRKDTLKKVSFLFCGLLIGYYLFNYTELIYSNNAYISVFGKFNNLSDTTARFASITINLKLVSQSPLFGNGIDIVETLFPMLSVQRYGIFNEHNTNTVLIQFATYGVFFGFIWLGYIYRFTQLISNSKFVSIMIFILFLILFVGENISNNILISTLFFYGTIYKKSICLEQELVMGKEL